MTATDTFIYAYTKSEDRKPPLEKQKMPPLFDEPTTWDNWHKHVNWPQSILLITVPLLGLYGAFTTELQQKTMIWSIIYYFFTGLGITAGNYITSYCSCAHFGEIVVLIIFHKLGYHRHWAHRAYRATLPLRWMLCIAGSGAVEGSIYWWSRGHRAHHRWTDTDKDPYSAHRGFFFSHFGWMLVNRPKNRIGYADVADLKSEPVVAFQHKYYPYFALAFGFILPTLVAGLGWGDFRVCIQNFFFPSLTPPMLTFVLIRVVSTMLVCAVLPLFTMPLSALTAWHIILVKLHSMIITPHAITGSLLL